MFSTCLSISDVDIPFCYKWMVNSAFYISCSGFTRHLLWYITDARTKCNDFCLFAKPVIFYVAVSPETITCSYSTTSSRLVTSRPYQIFFTSKGEQNMSPCMHWSVAARHNPQTEPVLLSQAIELWIWQIQNLQILLNRSRITGHTATLISSPNFFKASSRPQNRTSQSTSTGFIADHSCLFRSLAARLSPSPSPLLSSPKVSIFTPSISPGAVGRNDSALLSLFGIICPYYISKASFSWPSQTLTLCSQKALKLQEKWTTNSCEQ